MLGVGHRVVHGGATSRGPVRRHAGGPRRASQPRSRWLRSISPQSGRHRGRERAPARRAAGRLLRHELPPRAAGGGGAGAAAARRSAAPACSATASTGSPTSTSRRCCPRSRPRSPRGRVIVAHLGSGASLCALKARKSVDSTLGFTALDGLCMGTRPGSVDPGVILYLFQTTGALRRRSGDDSLQEVRAARNFGHQQRHARPARQPRPGGAPGGRLLRLPGGQADRRARRRARRRRRAGLHRRASASTPPRSAAGSARRRPGSASTWTRLRTRAHGPADLRRRTAESRRG